MIIFVISILVSITTTTSGRQSDVTSRRCPGYPEVEKVIGNRTYIHGLYQTWRASRFKSGRRKTGQSSEAETVGRYKDIMCGTVEEDIVPIMNGKIAPELTFQWTVEVTSDFTSCSGVLIDEWWVLTAAHCIPPDPKGLESLFIGVGRRPIDGDNDKEAHRYLKRAQKVFIHEEFDPSEVSFNDIALVKMKTRVEYDPRGVARPICLPQPYSGIIYELRNLTCYAAAYGWYPGWTQETGKLRYVRMELWKTEDCLRSWPDHFSWLLNLCGRPRSRWSHICMHDTGGPIVCKHRGPGYVDRYYLYGLISSSEVNCGLSIQPFIFTEVLSYYDWIKEKVRNETGTTPFWWTIPIEDMLNIR